MDCCKCNLLVALFLAFTLSFCVADTDPRDVAAMNILCVSLNLPPLRGWVVVGGDPCGEQWQGVSCVFSNITALNLSGLNLVGTLSNGLQFFDSIIQIDLSNNNIGGSIPSGLPTTLRNLSLAGNQFHGEIPDTLALLAQLLDLSLNDNLLSGSIPDAFQLMTGLTNLDLSGNHLTGLLPPSMGNLSSITSLHLRNNKLVGTLDVLQDLPLIDLNIENNLFSGPIPAKLLNIPNFRKDGNPFNTTAILPPPLALPPAAAYPPMSADSPAKQTNWHASSATPRLEISKGSSTTKSIPLIVALVVVLLVLFGVCVVMVTCCRRKQVKEDAMFNYSGAYRGHQEKSNFKPTAQWTNKEGKATKESNASLQDQYGVGNKREETISKQKDEDKIDMRRTNATVDHKIDMSDVDTDLTSDVDTEFTSIQPPPPPPSYLPTLPLQTSTSGHSVKSSNSSSLRVFTITTLQQYTNSFSEEYFLGEGTLGCVYRAELPNGQLLAVKKLNRKVPRQETDEEFLQLVSSLSRIHHDNMVDLVGYCNEYNERLLVYEYCKCGTLYDALHVDEIIHGKLSWNMRIQVALGAARALQYLHEVCQPPIVHRNFKSANVLLDDRLRARVSDCGLDSLISSISFSGRLLTTKGYTAPEIELGSYTCKSDVYSFGIVMLELFTGRKSYDSSRNRGEQSLVRWAIPRLHDIDALVKMVDPALHGAFSVKSLSRFADIISRCVQWEPEFRPLMSEIIQDLLQMK